MTPKSTFDSLLLLLAAVVAVPAALADPGCAPGGNFDLSFWSLQLPTGDSGSFTTIKSADLQGCSGYQDSNFSTDKSSGAIVLIAPGNPDLTHCFTSSGSSHCRTELREVDSKTGKNAAWSPKKTNSLTVSMTVKAADDGTHGTAIGQVFAADASKPLAEMYYSRKGEIVVGVKPDADSGQIVTKVGNVAVGTKFEYKLEYSKDVLTVTINGKATKLDTGNWDSPNCYFKTGNYNQGKSADSSKVVIAAIKVLHS
ncbi:hypothetical protein V502_00292 [Pseudogymnoascus sp. VKM F-4520 (FW-2644)]|nr:hypothetical protein V502_00292 [Pseudogymnoascus sp. VKM F-4520 (FW-2644)]